MPEGAGASPFHEGEQRVQERMGVRDAIEPFARRVVRPFLTEQHQQFYGAQPFLVLAARDERGRPWATIVAGDPGFATSPEPGRLAIGAQPALGDALDGALADGADVGVLGLEFATRRRNRVNGRIAASENGGLELAVEQSFGNCPQYIHEREWTRAEPARPPKRTEHDALVAAHVAAIEGADTFFIASGHRGEGESTSFGMDASHRGGEPGFVQVLGDREIVFPDYAGNDHYNTIGNLVLDPRVGLLFVDFEAGSLLQLTGTARVDFEPDAAAQVRFPGARRMVSIDVERVISLEAALPLRFGATAGSVRSLRLVARQAESADVTSFVFASRDGGPLPGHRAGQHLPIELRLADGTRVSRTYSLSGAPSERHYRISVKRHEQGLASRLLHDHVEIGAILDARAPAGDFVIREGDRPVVLVSAGVGVTPMVSMAHELVDGGDPRPLWFVHGVRDAAHRPLAGEVEALAARAPNLQVHTRASRPRRGDEGHDDCGRVDAALLERLVPGLDADFYLCGPPGFLADVIGGLEDAGVPDERIHQEAF